MKQLTLGARRCLFLGKGGADGGGDSPKETLHHQDRPFSKVFAIFMYEPDIFPFSFSTVL